MSTHKAFPNDSYTRSGDFVGNFNGGRSEISEMVSNMKRRNVRVMGGNSTYVGKRVLLVHHMDLEKAHKALREFYPKHYATDLMSNLKRDVETDKKMGVFENETNICNMKHLKLFESFDKPQNPFYNYENPTVSEIYGVLVKINKDSKKIDFSDTEYYTDQINNMYFNNVNGKDNFAQSKKWAESVSKVSDMVDKFKQKMSNSTKGTAAGWIDGAKELNDEEKRAVWDNIQDSIDNKHQDRTELPKWINESFDADDEKEPELNTMAKVIKELGSRGYVKMPVVQFIYDNIERLTGKDISHFQSIDDFSDESEPGIHVITNMIGYYQMDGDDFANDWDLAVKSKGKLKWKTNENTVNEASGLRIRLDEEDFKVLVSGGEVSGNGYKIILADIGWNVMLDTIQNAKEK